MRACTPTPGQLPKDTGMAKAIASIRARLDALELLPLDEENVADLLVVDDDLADILWAYEEAEQS